jgi:hypothetical protein
MKRAIGWAIKRNTMYYDSSLKQFCSSFSHNCFYEFSDFSDVQQIASNLKADVITIWVVE